MIMNTLFQILLTHVCIYIYTRGFPYKIKARIKRTIPSFIQVLHFNNQINIYILSPNYIVNFVVTQPARKNDVHFIMILRIKLRNFIPPEKAINCSNYVHNFVCDQNWSHMNCTYNFIQSVFGEP